MMAVQDTCRIQGRTPELTIAANRGQTSRLTTKRQEMVCAGISRRQALAVLMKEIALGITQDSAAEPKCLTCRELRLIPTHR